MAAIGVKLSGDNNGTVLDTPAGQITLSIQAKVLFVTLKVRRVWGFSLFYLGTGVQSITGLPPNSSIVLQDWRENGCTNRYVENGVMSNDKMK